MCNIGKLKLILLSFFSNDGVTLNLNLESGNSRSLKWWEKLSGKCTQASTPLFPYLQTSFEHLPLDKQPAKNCLGSFSSLQACGRWYPSIIPVKVSVFCQTAPFPTTRYNYLLYLQQNEVNHTFNHSVSQATYEGLPRASKYSCQLFRQKRKKNAEISLGKIFCIWFHLCWGQSGSDISLNLIWVDRIYTEKKNIKAPQQIIWKDVDTIYLTHSLCHIQDCLRPTSCINQGKLVETKFYLELSGFLYKMSSKINVSW